MNQAQSSTTRQIAEKSLVITRYFDAQRALEIHHLSKIALRL